MAQTIILKDGRLWKRNERSPAVLMFADPRLMVSLNAKGLLKVARMPTQVADLGYELALAAILQRTAMKLSLAPVVSPIGRMVTVLDMRSFSDTFAQAA